MMSKFKDTINRWRTTSLFKESAIMPREFVLFTYDEARQLYIACNDPTGYVFATTHLGGWKHFLACRNSPKLEEEILRWEEELEVKLRAEAVGNMIKLADGDKGYQANKFLVDGGWIQKKAGRPTAESKRKAIKQHVEEYSELKGSADLRH